MVALTITCVAETRAAVGEGPVWDPRDEALWWTDIKGRTVHRFDPRTGRDRSFAMPIRVGSLALRQSGGFILAAEHGFWGWSPEGGPAELIVDVEADRPDNRMNDGGCDRQGRFVAASMSLAPDRPATGACWRLDASLNAVKLVGDLRVGNGIAFSPCGDRFYLADTLEGRVWCHDYGADGTVGVARTFLDTRSLAGKPDGATVDAERHYWLAGVYGAQLYRVAPDGRLDRTIDLPFATPTCPRFGGRHLDELYVTSLGESLPAPAGGLFRIQGLSVAGIAETPFPG